MPLTLALTPGDPTGIGPEITAKALARLDELHIRLTLPPVKKVG
jgi:4-hydroxy-L-threonine phosphate dehydrogenase PdxA